MKIITGFFVILFSLHLFAGQVCDSSSDSQSCQAEADSTEGDSIFNWMKSKVKEAEKSLKMAKQKVVAKVWSIWSKYFSETQPEVMPSYFAPKKKQQKAKLERIEKKIKAQKLYQVLKKGIKSLKPASLKTIDRYSLLELGREPELSSLNWKFSRLDNIKVKIESIRPLKSPLLQESGKILDLSKDLVLDVKKNLEKNLGKKFDKKKRKKQRPVDMLRVREFVWKSNELNPETTRTYQEIGDGYFAVLIAEMFENQGDCFLALGIAQAPLKSSLTEMRISSRKLATRCLVELELYRMAVEQMDETLKSQEGGLASLNEKFPMELHSVLETVYLKHKDLLATGVVDPYAYIIVAKALVKSHQLNPAAKWSRKVEANSPHFSKAQFLLATIESKLGRGRQAEKRFKSLLHGKMKLPAELKNVARLNLARTYYQNGQFKKSIHYYQQVERASPFWIAALTEMGWAQLSLGDFAGSVGNMYSLHIPLFDGLYQPQSYIIRTIGYINLCQYPDAYKSLSFLEKRYSAWKAKIDQYLSQAKSHRQIYDDYVGYMKSKSGGDVAGLPRQVLRELSRMKKTTNLQKYLNHMVWEARGFEKYQAKYKKVLAKIEKKKTLLKAEQKNQENSRSTRLRIGRKLRILNEFEIMVRNAQRGVATLGRSSTAKREKEKEKIKISIGRKLLSTLQGLQKELIQVSENNEFLRYEIYAGSGENLREMTKNSQKRVLASTMPKSKELRWAFDGEIWLDEIGYFRSSLKNNCLQRSVKHRKTAQTY